MSSNIDKAQQAWGNKAIPYWVITLAKACDNSSQSKVARQLQYSSAVVNTVLKNTYKGNLKAIERAVNKAFSIATIHCPVIGMVTRNDCLTHQRKPYCNTNPLRVQLFRTCRDCSNNLSIGGSL